MIPVLCLEEKGCVFVWFGCELFLGSYEKKKEIKPSKERNT